MHQYDELTIEHLAENCIGQGILKIRTASIVQADAGFCDHHRGFGPSLLGVEQGR